MKHKALLLILGMLISGCNSGLSTFNAQNSEMVSVNEIPLTFESPADEPNSDEANNSVDAQAQASTYEETQTQATVQTQTDPHAQTTPQSSTPSSTKSTTQSSTTQPSEQDTNQDPAENPRLDSKPSLLTQIKTKAAALIETADLVMRYEGKKIGTACNYFVQRVLSVMGFPMKGFTANSFPEYVKKYFKSYRAEKFVNDKQGTDRNKLKLHIWSYPERTPFIFQWGSSPLSAHGHVAIVERVQDHLIIYQSSLNRYTARKDQTTVDRLLSGWARRQLTVFSDFE